MKFDKYNKATDKEVLLELVSRLSDFTLPDGVPEEIFKAKQASLMEKDLENESNTIMVVKQDGHIIAFIQLETDVDWISGEKYGYISRIIVSESAEGNGLGKKLMTLAEEWATENGYSAVGLNVFSQNTRAFRLYESIGYKTETVKMMKRL
ncbi:GNAT family N-acetyltransferase [Enterococcus sp. LJL90]